MERDDGDGYGRECKVGGTMGEEGIESVVESWMFVRRVERKAEGKKSACPMVYPTSVAVGCLARKM